MIDQMLSDAAEKMVKAIGHLQEEFAGVRTGRANPGLIDKLRVEYYGTETPIKQLATFSVPEARVLLVSPFDKSSMKAIEKAISDANLGLNPSNDGNVIRLSFPSLTAERRKDLVKMVKGKAEDAKVAVRNVRRSTRAALEAKEKDSEIGSDDLKRAGARLDKLTEENISDVDKLLAAKEQELLEV